MESIWNAPYVENDKLAACGETAARLLPPRGEARAEGALSGLRRDGSSSARRRTSPGAGGCAAAVRAC